MHVRIRLHDPFLAACINRFVKEGTNAGLRTAAELCTMHNYLQIVENQFNQTLPLKDLREETIKKARGNKKTGVYFVEDARFTQSISIFLESITIIELLPTLLGRKSRSDRYSHVCEIPWKDEALSALAFYIDPQQIRALTIWWMGPSKEVNQVVNSKGEVKLWSLEPDYMKWLKK